MHFGSDESGDFNMSQSWDKSCSVWVTVVCPDRQLDRVRAWVADRCDEWNVAELHALKSRKTRGLSPQQRHTVCAFVGTGDLLWEATVVDSLMLSATDVVARQDKQLARFQQDWKDSKRCKSTDPEDVAYGELVEELLNPSGGVKTAPFVQYAAVAPQYVRETVQSTIRVFEDPKWRGEFQALRMVFDRKNEPERKESPGEILFFNAVMPILAGPRVTLDLPPTFQDPSHPRRAARKPISRDGIDIHSLLAGGVRFVDSAEDALVQLADVLAYVLRRALTRLQDADAQRSWAVARPRLYKRAPTMFSEGDFATVERYHHVLR